MTLQIQCPACRKVAALPDSAAGKNIQCGCGQVITMPLIVSQPPAVDPAVSGEPNNADSEMSTTARQIREQRERDEAKLAATKAAALSVITYLPTKVSTWFKRKPTKPDNQPVGVHRSTAPLGLAFCPKCAEPWLSDARYCAKCAWDSMPVQSSIMLASTRTTNQERSSTLVGTAINIVFAIIGSSAKIVVTLIVLAAIAAIIYLQSKPTISGSPAVHRVEQSVHKIEIAGDVARINNEPITLPITLEKCINLFGQPSRFVDKSPIKQSKPIALLIWDEDGISCVEDIVDGIRTGQTTNLTFVLAPDASWKSPKTPFRGTIQIDGIGLTSQSSPLSVPNAEPDEMGMFYYRKSPSFNIALYPKTYVDSTSGVTPKGTGLMGIYKPSEKVPDKNKPVLERLIPKHTAKELWEICSNGDVAKAVVILQADPSLINAVSVEYKEPALLGAASYGKVDVVKVLLEKGADANSRSEHDFTALHFAAAKGNIEIARLLINSGADANAKNSGGCTPLFSAVTPSTPEIPGGRKAVVELLLDKGADSNARSLAGESVLQKAVGFGESEIVAILKAHGAK